MHTALCVFGGAEFFQDFYMNLFSLKSYEAYFEIFFLFHDSENCHTAKNVLCSILEMLKT